MLVNERRGPRIAPQREDTAEQGERTEDDYLAGTRMPPKTSMEMRARQAPLAPKSNAGSQPPDAKANCHPGKRVHEWTWKFIIL